MVASALSVGGGGGAAAASAPTRTSTPRWPGRPTPTRPRHPRVLFDEAHHNFHTASGRYKPFAELITSDGYQVIPNREKFTREVAREGRYPGHRQRAGGRGDGPARGGESGVHRRRVRRRPRLGQGRRLAAVDHRPRPVRLGRRVPGQAVRRGHEQGGHLRPGELGGRRDEPGLQPPEPPPGRPPDHAGPRRLRAGQPRPDLHRHVAQGPRGERRRSSSSPTPRSTSRRRRQAGLGRRPGQGLAFTLRQGPGRRPGRGRRALGPGHRRGESSA